MGARALARSLLRGDLHRQRHPARLRRADFLGLIFGLTRLDDRMASGDVVVEGDVGAVAALLSLVDPLDPHFNVVTP